MSKHINYILGLCVAALVVLCALSISEPLRQDRSRGQREQVVRQRMSAILQAENNYRRSHGVYTGSFGELIGLRLLADSMRYVPYSGRQEFELEATVDVGSTGRQEPSVRVAAEYGQYLNGTDENRIEQLRSKAAAQGRYPGVEMTLPKGHDADLSPQ